jgi:hypothetical protein
MPDLDNSPASAPLDRQSRSTAVPAPTLPPRAAQGIAVFIDPASTLSTQQLSSARALLEEVGRWVDLDPTINRLRRDPKVQVQFGILSPDRLRQEIRRRSPEISDEELANANAFTTGERPTGPGRFTFLLSERMLKNPALTLASIHHEFHHASLQSYGQPGRTSAKVELAVYEAAVPGLERIGSALRSSPRVNDAAVGNDLPPIIAVEGRNREKARARAAKEEMR